MDTLSSRHTGPQDVDALSPIESRRCARAAAALVAACAGSTAAYAWAAAARLDLPDRPAAFAVAACLLAGVWAAAWRRPLAVTLALLAVLPLFGNHPGGRLMEIINLPLAAAAAGLALEARRQRLPLPRGAVWLAAALFVITAVVAMAPALPGMAIRAAQLNDAGTVLMESLTSHVDNPLYSASSLWGLLLCAAWAWALAWRAPDAAFFTRALRVLTWVFLAVVALGVLDYHGLISLVDGYMLRVDPRRPDVSGLQSIFWNPGWFAWYFVMAFALALGLLWRVGPRERAVLGGLLGLSYLYSFLNPQRGGLVALHVCLGLAALQIYRDSPRRSAIRRALPIAAAAMVAAVAAAYFLEWIPQSLGSSLFRLVESPDETDTSNSIRLRLWTVAAQMWRDAPIFGLGEGSFGWRFTDYAPPGSPLYTVVHGDAHSTWMQLLATRGLAGVAAFALLLATVGRALVRGREAGRLDRGVVLGCGLALAGFVVYATVQGMFYLQGIQILFWLIVAVAALGAPPAARTRVWRPGAATAALAAAAVVLVQAMVTVPLAARAADVIARQPRGFYPAEPGDPGWRWSTGEGTLCLSPPAPELELRLAAGDPRPSEYPRTVTLRVGERVLDRFLVSGPDVVARTLRLPAAAGGATPAGPFGECLGTPGEIHLTVEVSDTWSPLAEGLGTDARTLGVQLFEPEFGPE